MPDSVEQMLYQEAHLLDSGRFVDWLDLMAPDLRYWAPVRADLPRAEEAEDESSRLPLFDETRASLELRISRLATGLAWVDVPPTRTRRYVSNVMSEEREDGLRFVRSNILVFRSRSFSEDWFVAGCREDLWSVSDAWLLKERKILLDHCRVENLPLFL